MSGGMSWKDAILLHRGGWREQMIKNCLKTMAAEGEWAHIESLRDSLTELITLGMVDLDDSADGLTPEMFEE